jgi:hypothetical protein
MTNISKVLDNAFIIKRHSTKHKKDFKYNTFERPLTHSDFFMFINKCSDTKLNMHECYLWMINEFALNFLDKHKSDIKLIIGKGVARIQSNKEYLEDISLDFSKVCDLLSFFKDLTLFETDYKELSKSDIYYK